MRFLLYSYNFSPEKTGIGKYNGELAEWLIGRGHEVDVITSNPYYPEWKVHPQYRHKKWRTERSDRLTVYRCPMYVPTRLSGPKRMLSDLSFIITSSIFWLRVLFKPRYDVVMAVCPSLFVGLFPTFYQKVRGGIFVFHIQDLQLDAAISMGMLKNKAIIRSLQWIERIFLRQATFVSSISEGMKQHILHKGVAKEKYLMLENWVDTEFIAPLSQNTCADLRREIGLTAADRVVLYSGNMGEKQGLEIIIEAAKLLSKHKDWKFVLCGDGTKKQELKALAEELPNVSFIDLISYGRLPELLSLAEVHLVPQKRVSRDLVLPSKVGSILGVGGLAIVAADINTSLYNLMESRDLGILVQPEHVQQLVSAIEVALTRNHDPLRLRARQFAEENLNIEVILSGFERSVQDAEADLG